jgi:uncharacterized membrane protein
MADVPVQLIIAAFNDGTSAQKALDSLEQAEKEKLIKIDDAAVLTKDQAGTLRIRETKDMRGGKGAVVGGILGATVGLLAGPVGWAALGGAAIGGLAAKAKDGGFPDQRLKEIGEGLTPGSSALITVVEHTWVEQVEQELAEQGAQVATEAIASDIASQLKAGQDVGYTVVADSDAVLAARATEPSAGTAQGQDAGNTVLASSNEAAAAKPTEPSAGTAQATEPPAQSTDTGAKPAAS